MPIFSRRTPERSVSAAASGPSTSSTTATSNQDALSRMNGVQSTSESPTLSAAGLGEAAPLKSFPGYDEAWHAANDGLIRRVVAEFNAEKGLDASNPNYLDPDLVKAWALQESGGHQDVFTGGDMMQVNNRGDWVREKGWFGLEKGIEPLPEASLRSALDWAWYKGERTRAKRGNEAADGWHDTQRGTEAFPGYESQFIDWKTALSNYNGGGVSNYYRDIQRRYQGGR